jgi:two-component system, NtrC family, nitrogen regulation sensor histidine kinase NtrY
MVTLFRQNRILIIAFLFFGVSFLLYNLNCNPSLEKNVQILENEFQKKELKLSQNLNLFANSFSETDSHHTIWDKTRQFKSSIFDYYIYKDDSLFFWTTNHAPSHIDQLSDSINTIVLLENGWYFAEKRIKGSLTIIGLFLIKNEFPYQNESLTNNFDPSFSFPFNAKITQIPDKYSVTNSNGDFSFSLIDISSPTVSSSLQVLIFLFFSIGLTLFCYVLIDRTLQVKILSKFSPLLLILVLLLRWWSIKWDWFSFFGSFELFDPQLFASSILLPTLGDLILNILVVLVIYLIGKKHYFTNPQVNKNTVSKLTGILAFIVFYCVSFLIAELCFRIISDSDIPLALHQLITLNEYSYLIILLFGLIFWMYFSSTIILLNLVVKTNFTKTTVGLIWFFGGLIYFLIELFLEQRFFSVTIMPLVFSGLILLMRPWNRDKFSFPQMIVLLVLFAGYTAIQLYSTFEIKEKEKREIYAKKLISDKDLNTEIAYAQLEPILRNHPILLDVFNQQQDIQKSQIKLNLEKRFFTNYWNKYELDFFLFYKDSTPVVSYTSPYENRMLYFESLISKSSEVSDVNQNIYYIIDYSDKLSYIIKQPIETKEGDLLGYLYCTLKSKIIPQEIGFPRLLINDYSRVFFPLEEYAMGKYVKEKLVSKYGAYHYPLTIRAFLQEHGNVNGFVEKDQQSFYILDGEYNRTVILNRPSMLFTEKLTTFSFFFSFYGLGVLCILFFSGQLIPDWKKLKLAFKIQLMLVSLVFFSLLFLSIGTGSFVKDQYRDYRDGLIREKLSSVHIEMVQKLGFESTLNKAKMANYLEYLLQKFSNVFITDINLYDLNGKLLASSRPEIYRLGLLSEQMNPRAYRHMNFKNKSVFLHEESIGTLNYLSAYIPLQNNDEKVIAYLNLPYFAKQNEFENEITGFLSAIINIFVLLLALSVVVSVFVTNRITEPLKLIQLSLAGLKLGKHNQPISYKGNDEIGALVQAYNQKLEELEENTERLAQTEREMAWREMAKQVAHEIKNPLTPMKLRLQHLQRSFDPQAEDATERLNHVAQSIIEQIDSLTNIANEFSNFAKLPRPKEEILDLTILLKNVVELYAETENIDIRIDSSDDINSVFADKDLMIRVFNNLIKNAIQAIPDEIEGQIHIQIAQENNAVCISIKDNGSGIPDEMRDKIFAPNFTTKTTGMGLGLAMVKQIIESHNGSISFESSPLGTTFYVYLKLS